MREYNMPSHLRVHSWSSNKECELLSGCPWPWILRGSDAKYLASKFRVRHVPVRIGAETSAAKELQL
jgi:hypothetical protein